MKVEIEGMNQHLDFNGSGVVNNFLTVLLPTGDRITVQVGPKDLELLIASVGEEFAERGVESTLQQAEPPSTFEQPLPQAFEDATFDPEETTVQPFSTTFGGGDEPVNDSPSGAFEQFVGADVEQATPQFEVEEMVVWAELPDDVLPPEMKQQMEQLHIAQKLPTSALVQITDQLSERMMAQATLASPPQQQQSQQPQQRARVMNTVPPRRTVPTNEMGYPKVVGAGNDPGEFARDADEDGVAQL